MGQVRRLSLSLFLATLLVLFCLLSATSPARAGTDVRSTAARGACSLRADEEITPTATSEWSPLFNTPTPMPTGSYNCPDGNPVGYGTVTPDARWYINCGQCLNRYVSPTPSASATPTPVISGTVTPTATGQVTGSLSALYVGGWLDGDHWSGPGVSRSYNWSGQHCIPAEGSDCHWLLTPQEGPISNHFGWWVMHPESGWGGQPSGGYLYGDVWLASFVRDNAYVVTETTQITVALRERVTSIAQRPDPFSNWWGGYGSQFNFLESDNSFLSHGDPVYTTVNGEGFYHVVVTIPAGHNLKTITVRGVWSGWPVAYTAEYDLQDWGSGLVCGSNGVMDGYAAQGYITSTHGIYIAALEPLGALPIVTGTLRVLGDQDGFGLWQMSYSEVLSNSLTDIYDVPTGYYSTTGIGLVSAQFQVCGDLSARIYTGTYPLPTPSPTPSPTPAVGVCGTINSGVTTSGTLPALPVPIVGPKTCLQIGPYNIGFDLINSVTGWNIAPWIFPGINLCFQSIYFGDLDLLGIKLSLDALTLAFGAFALIRHYWSA